MKRFLLLAAALLLSSPIAAQVTSSGAQQVQGTSGPTRGNPVNVVLTDGSGTIVTSTTPTGPAGTPNAAVVSVQGISGGTVLPISAASLPLPTGAATSAAQTTAGASLTAIAASVAGATPAGTNIMGRVGIDQTTQGTTNLVTIANAGATFANSINVTPSFVWTATDAYANTAMGWQITPSGGNIVPATGNFIYDETTWDRQRGDVVATSVLPGLSGTFWRYTSGASPILSNTTTAVTIKTAAGASVRNYVTSCQITTTAFGASVPLALRDGAAGTVIWALTVPTAGFLQPVTVTFPVPLRGTANTLLEIVTTTANTTGTVTANCQGFTGA